MDKHAITSVNIHARFARDNRDRAVFAVTRYDDGAEYRDTVRGDRDPRPVCVGHARPDDAAEADEHARDPRP